jgi:hypothetical protein|tara:strand:+ start:143 stop:313 length:171 start_codon:yes stop_codon:yes gene_type:complete
MDRIYKVIVKGYIVQKDYESPPDNWEWGRALEIGVPFIDTPHVTITELVDEGDNNE